MHLELLQIFQKLSSGTYNVLRAFENWADEQTLEQVVEQVTADRYRLAEKHYEFAHTAFAQIDTDGCHLSVISRSYYAMFHGGRCAVYHTARHDMDDHKTRPTHVGTILGTVYQDLLVKWRELRNAVDYSPYPDLKGMALKDAAAQALTEARPFLDAVHVYLTQRGVSV
ncbi:hypothetical protein HYR99_10055 [Candidatus Poribacteria bacterium]|nr:hypothetical protein [Candidatus Poribacteria bacterium]